MEIYIYSFIKIIIILGLRIDKDEMLWGVENGVDELARSPWGNIHNENPAEELNCFGNLNDTDAGYGSHYE